MQILEGFYYGRAFAVTLSRRLGELVVEVVSDVTKTIAEQPQRWEEFQVRPYALIC
jgi:predicted mannosyl-3-phosphoglycerate phosphatase (HAD superfamily)